MPHDEDCPYEDCGKSVKDWFIEWYPKPKQLEIGKYQRAMDCPWCGRPVLPSGLKVILPKTAVPFEKRDYRAATAYARTQTPVGQTTPYPSLEAFLSDPDNAAKAAPYKRGYWRNVNIP
jgi:hypothetical protein